MANGIVGITPKRNGLHGYGSTVVSITMMVGGLAQTSVVFR